MDLKHKLKGIIPFRKKQKKGSNKFNTTNTSPKWYQKILTLLQNLGKSLIYPIAILPFAALLNRFGALGVSIAHNAGHDGQVDWWIATIIQTPGITVFNNLAIFFAIGTAFGLAKDHRGEAALVGAMFYLILAAFSAEGSIPTLFYKNVLTFRDQSDGNLYSQLFYIPTINSVGQITKHTWILDIGVLGGIVAGCTSAYLYNRLKEIRLPAALAFFGGRRFVPMIAGLVAVPTAFLFAVIWPWIQYVLIQFGNQISSSDSWAIPGSFFYGVINRLAQPFGLHHILNTFLWFQLPITGDSVAPITGKVTGHNLIVNGDITAFNNGLASAGVFQSGYFPLFMGGEPGIAFAMMFAIKNKAKRKEVGVFLAGVASVAFLTGIDEPLVFSFIFISPLLWVMYAFYTGIFNAIVTAMHIHLGFGFSAGFIDYVISFAQSWGISQYNGNKFGSVYKILGNPLMILPLAVASFSLFFFTFLPVIKKFNVMTPGREADQVTVDGSGKAIIRKAAPVRAPLYEQGSGLKKNKKNLISKTTGKKMSRKERLDLKYDTMAAAFLKAVGGSDNVTDVGNCATRLRLNVKSNKNIDDAAIKAAGGLGIVKLGLNGIQIVVGTDVEFVANAFTALLPRK